MQDCLEPLPPGEAYTPAAQTYVRMQNTSKDYTETDLSTSQLSSPNATQKRRPSFLLAQLSIEFESLG